MFLYKELSNEILKSSIEVHKHLGPGLLESAYEICLLHEFMNAGLSVERQLELPIIYKGLKLDCGYRMDIVVEKKIIIELKAVESLNKIHEAQILTYLKLSEIRVGLLMNFNVKYLKDGIKRFVL